MPRYPVSRLTRRSGPSSDAIRCRNRGGPRVVAPAVVVGLGLSLGLVGVLGGCVTDSDWREVRNGATIPQPRVTVDQVRVTLAFPDAGRHLPDSERRRLMAFLQGSGARPGDRVHVIGSSLDDPATVQARTRAIAPVLAALRLAPSVPTNDLGLNDPAPGTLSLILRRYAVTVPGCPDMSDSLLGNFDNRTHSNFGCATAVNLGLMVEDPHDLLRGRDLGPMEGRYAARGAYAYLAGQAEEPDTITLTLTGGAAE